MADAEVRRARLRRLVQDIAEDLGAVDELVHQASNLNDAIRAEHRSPNDVEKMALAAMLHHTYTGIESVFSRVAEVLDGGMPTGSRWHADLLRSMKFATDDRPAVIDDESHAALDEYRR